MTSPAGLPQWDDPPEIEPDSWTPVRLTSLPDKPPVQPTLGDAGLVYPGKRHVFSGPPESAKTLAAYAIGITVTRTGATIILIDFEMGSYDARDRLRELGAEDDELDRIHYLEPAEPASDIRIRRLLQLDASLVIIDAAAGAYDLEGLDDNKRADVEKLARLYVRSFWRKGVATIFIDHVVKNADSRGKYAIGSERKLGGTDVHLGFETITPISRGSSGLYKIVTHKDRGGWLKRGHIADLHLASDPISHQIEWAIKPAEITPPDQPFRPTTLMERISGWLRLQTEPVPRKAVEDGVKGQNRQAKRDALDALTHEGFVLETPGKHGARLVQSIRAYRADDPDCNPQTSRSSPTSPNLAQTSPGEIKTTSPRQGPPYGGQARLSGEDDCLTSPRSSWLDELAATVDLDQDAGDLDDDG